MSKNKTTTENTDPIVDPWGGQFEDDSELSAREKAERETDESIKATLEAINYLQSISEEIPDNIPSGRIKVVEVEDEDLIDMEIPPEEPEVEEIEAEQEVIPLENPVEGTIDHYEATPEEEEVEESPEDLYRHFLDNARGKTIQHGDSDEGFNRELSMAKFFLDEEIKTSISTALMKEQHHPQERGKASRLDHSQYVMYTSLVFFLILCTGIPALHFNLIPGLGDSSSSTKALVNKEQPPVSSDLVSQDNPFTKSLSGLKSNRPVFASALSPLAKVVSESFRTETAVAEAVINASAGKVAALVVEPPAQPEPQVELAVEPVLLPEIQEAEPKKFIPEPKVPEKVEIPEQEIEDTIKVAFVPGWFVQIAAKETEEEAAVLVDLLRSKGFRTLTRDAEVKGKLYHRVIVGPEASRPKATALLSKINTIPTLDKGPFVRYFE